MYTNLYTMTYDYMINIFLYDLSKIVSECCKRGLEQVIRHWSFI